MIWRPSLPCAKRPGTASSSYAIFNQGLSLGDALVRCPETLTGYDHRLQSNAIEGRRLRQGITDSLPSLAKR